MLRVLGALLRRGAPAASRSTATPFAVPGVRGPALARAAAVEQGRAVFAAPRAAGAGRQHRLLITDDAQRHARCSTRRASARSTPPVFDAMRGADGVLVDGTFWTDDEMIAPRPVGSKTRARHRPPAAVAAPAA